MGKDFDSRYTHALLMAILVVVSDRGNTFAAIAYPIIAITMCVLFAWSWPRFVDWSNRK